MKDSSTIGKSLPAEGSSQPLVQALSKAEGLEGSKKSKKTAVGKPLQSAPNTFSEVRMNLRGKRKAIQVIKMLGELSYIKMLRCYA